MFEKIAIVVSTKDAAGMNIKKRLIETGKFVDSEQEFMQHPIYIFKDNERIRLYTTELDSVYNENIDQEINADLFIFATKHQSKSGIHSLSAHVQGNWGKAEFGGQDKKVAKCPATYIREALLKLEQLKNREKLDFEVVQECTHHGPYMEKPSMFIEIGSDETQWVREDAAKVIAETIIYLLDFPAEQVKTIIGIGGQHTCTNFDKLRSQGYAIGHVCPKYMLDQLEKHTLIQAVEQHVEKVDMIVLDWKGLGEHKEKIKEMTDDIASMKQIPVKRIKDF